MDYFLGASLKANRRKKTTRIRGSFKKRRTWGEQKLP